MFLNNLDKLSTQISRFNKSAEVYYIQNTKKSVFNNELRTLNNFIDQMLMNNFKYIQAKFSILEKTVYFTFLIILLIAITYRKKLTLIYQDIQYLYSDKSNKDYKISFEETGSIKLRIGRKNDETVNSAHIDPLTELKNYKGLLSDYSGKKDTKDHYVTSVTVFEIDNFSEDNRAYNEAFTQTILKKVGFAISLYKQPSDFVARTDYNQFTVVLSRSSKEQSFKDADTIRKSISDIKLKEPHGEEIVITLSGGYIVKSSSQNLEDTIKKSKEILQYAKKKTTNSIFQLKDLVHTEI